MQMLHLRDAKIVPEDSNVIEHLLIILFRVLTVSIQIWKDRQFVQDVKLGAVVLVATPLFRVLLECIVFLGKLTARIVVQVIIVMWKPLFVSYVLQARHVMIHQFLLLIVQ